MLKGWLDPTTAEAMATIKAIKLCKELDVENVIIEGDAQAIIQALQGRDQNGNRYGQLVKDAKLILNSLLNWQPNHICRNLNGEVFRLAKLVTRHIINRIWRNKIPNCICDII